MTAVYYGATYLFKKETEISSHFFRARYNSRIKIGRVCHQNSHYLIDTTVFLYIQRKTRQITAAKYNIKKGNGNSFEVVVLAS